MVQENIVIEMQNITKEFGTFKANDNINLQVKAGEIHALLGENGAGKSTLMNVLSGLLEPTSGKILMRGKEVKIKHEKRSKKFLNSMDCQSTQMLTFVIFQLEWNNG